MQFEVVVVSHDHKGHDLNHVVVRQSLQKSKKAGLFGGSKRDFARHPNRTVVDVIEMIGVVWFMAGPSHRFFSLSVLSAPILT